MINYYHILGLDRDATAEDIKKAYRKLSMKFHPDKNEGDKYFEEWSKKVNAAFETLGNPSKKVGYDYALTHELEKKETAQPPSSTDDPQLALLKEIRRQLPEYYDAKNNLELARSNYERLTEQESPLIISTSKAIFCIFGIVASIAGICYLLMHGK